jgi:hypothetical protein
MSELQWQLIMEKVRINPGATLNVVGSCKDDRGRLFVLLSDPETRVKTEFWLLGAVNISGKDYLFLRKRKSVAKDIYVVRFQSGNYVAMDSDRFSSLQNALNLYMESQIDVPLESLERFL